MNVINKIGPGLFRLILSLTVVFYHTTKFIGIGGWAVFVFFILSGYWVSRMYTEKYSGFQNSIITFYLSRILRLLPVFHFTLLLYLLVVFWVKDLTFFTDYLKWMGNFHFIISHLIILGLNFSNFLLPPSWSLDIELQFYLLIPFILPLFLTIKRKYVEGILLVIFLSFFLFGHLYFHFPPTVIQFILFFYIGILIYKYDYLSEKILMSFSTFLFFGLLLVTYLHPLLLEEVVKHDKLQWFGFSVRHILDLLLAILTIPFLSNNIRTKGNSFDRHYASLSYIIYLFHWVTLYPYGIFCGNLPFKERIPYFIGYIIITMGGSLLIYYLIDIPSEKLRKRLFEKKKSIEFSLKKE